MEMTIESLREKGLIIFEAYRGSKAYGTFIEGKSDLDKVLIYMDPLDKLLSLKTGNQINEDNNDTVAYEFGRFLSLLQSSNPTVCEALWTPEDCIIYKHPIMDRLIAMRDIFISKKMKNSFGGYGVQQIRKASGLNKKMNMEKEKVQRADVLNFCYTPNGQGSKLIEDWLSDFGLKQEYCGLVAIPHMRYTYGVYYDIAQHCQIEKLDKFDYEKELMWKVWSLNMGEFPDYDQVMDGMFKNLKYKGIVQDKITSNDISLSTTPKDALPITHMTFNKDGYSVACKEYSEYKEWEKNHNKARFVDVKNHGQKIDGKNMLHCMRLGMMSREIATGQGLNVRRSPEDAKYLIDIRHGVYDLEEILVKCEKILSDNDKLFDESNLPDDVDMELINNLAVTIRREFYNLDC